MNRLSLLRSFPVVLAAILACACEKTYEEPPPVDQLPPRDRFHLFLLAGQSNMAGRGEVGDEDRAVHPRVFSLSQSGEWIPAVDPVHFDKEIAGVGLGRSFGIALAGQDETITVGLIPAAVGGSAIASWTPGGFHEQTGVHPYDDALARTRRAMEDGSLKAILWHQGESDAEPGLAAMYKGNLRRTISQFRQDLQQPGLPVIIGQLGRFPGKDWSEHEQMIDRAHREIAEEDPDTAFVSSEGLSDNGDRIHFDAGSLREFGRRYAEAYRELTDPSSK